MVCLLMWDLSCNPNDAGLTGASTTGAGLGTSTGGAGTTGGTPPYDGGHLDIVPDAGSDAGAMDDAGEDAGVDAGSAGCHSDDECPLGQFCDSAQTPAACFAPPIQHVVILVKENHTFDNYFGSFPGAEGIAQIQTPAGTLQVTEAPDQTSHDLCHAHSCALTDWDNGKMDGWQFDGGSDTALDGLAYQQYYEQDIPNYWAYARTYGLADHFFSGDMGPSFPGHLFPLAAQSAGFVGNPSNLVPWGCDSPSDSTAPQLDFTTGAITQVFPCVNIPSLPDLLSPQQGWKFYGTDYPSWLGLGGIWSMFDAIKPIHDSPAYQTNLVSWSHFQTDVQSGVLPAVTWLVDQDEYDEHPSDCISVCDGENWTVGNLNALMQSSLWQNTVVLITWDDFGGWYDHVAPPVQVGPNPAQPFGWGMRLPLLLISPYAKPGYIFQKPSNHASIVRFTERVLGLHKSLHDLDPNAQDSQVDDLFDAFDFHQQPNPPLILQQRSDCPGVLSISTLGCFLNWAFSG